MSDMLLFENGGATQVGFLKFNFTKKAMTNMEAEHMLFALRTFSLEERGFEVNLNNCILVDVFSEKFFKAANIDLTKESTSKLCREIKEKWPLL